MLIIFFLIKSKYFIGDILTLINADTTRLEQTRRLTNDLSEDGVGRGAVRESCPDLGLVVQLHIERDELETVGAEPNGGVVGGQWCG